MIMGKVDFRERFNETVMKDRVVFFCQSIFFFFFFFKSQ